MGNCFIKGVVLAFFLVSSIANGAIITSQGAGSAISNVTNHATFDSLTGGQSLLNYREGGLNISVDAINGSYDGIYFGSGGNYSFVEITATGNFLLSGIEMDVFTGSSLEFNNLVWQTLRGGIETGSGIFRGLNAGVAYRDVQTTVGWSDENFFDTIRVGLGYGQGFGLTEYTQFGQYNHIALDNVRAELVGTSSIPVTNVPEPSAFALSLLGLVLLGKRKHVSKLLKSNKSRY